MGQRSTRELAAAVLRRARHEIKDLQWKLEGKRRLKTTLSTVQGVLSVYTQDQGIARDLFIDGQFEWHLTERVTAWLSTQTTWRPTTGVVVDIGANIGVISIGMLRHRLFCHAVAMEPEARNFSLLQENVALNGLNDAMTCLQVALGSQPGTVAFELSGSNFGDHRVHAERVDAEQPNLYDEATRPVVTVEVDTLDHILATRLAPGLAEQVALVWIDVQGFEGFVFRGGVETFRRGIPVFAEVWPYGIRRTGMGTDEYCAIAQELWKSYWVWRRGRFVRYPTLALPSLMDELGERDEAENVILS